MDLKLQVLLAAIDRATGPLRKVTGSSATTAKALKATRDRLKELDRAQQQLQGFRALKNQAGATSIALKAAQQRTVALRTALAAVENPTKKAALALARAERETTKLKNAHIAKLRALRDSRAGLAAAGIETKRLGERERWLRKEIAATTAIMDKQQRKLKHLAVQSDRLSRARMRMAKAQGAAGGIAAGGAVMMGAGTVTAAPSIAAVQQYSSFQDAMTGVARQMRGARDDAGRLTPLYFKMGQSIKELSENLPGTAEEIAAIVEAGARMGIQGQSNLLQYARTTAIMADAFDLPVEEVGQDVSMIAKLYQVPIKNLTMLGDTVNWLDDNTQAMGGDIIDVLKRISGPARMVGMDFRKAAALGSTFLALGTGREVSATASNAMINNLANATMQSKRFGVGLKMLNLDAAQLQKNMSVDATGTILKVLEAIKTLPKEKQLEAATRLFGKEFGDDASKLANNIGEYRRQLVLASSAEAGGSMAREGAARAKNLSAAWANAKDSMRNTASELGALLAPALDDMIRKAQLAAQQVRAFIKEHPVLAGNILKVVTVGGLMIAALGAIAVGLAGVMAPLALLKFSMATIGIKGAWLAKIFPIVAKGLMFVGRALIANPIGLTLMVIAGAAYLIYKNWDKVKAGLGAAWDYMKVRVSELWVALKTIFAWTPLGLIITNWNTITTFLGGLWTRFKAIGGLLMDGLVGGLLGGLKRVGETITGIGAKVVGWMRDKLGIRSPSRVFAQIGHYTMAGLAGGLDRGSGQPIKALSAVARNLRAAGAGLALGAALPAAAGLPSIDTRAPLSATRGGQGGGGDTFHISIHAPAGSQAQDIADLVRAEIEKVQRQKSARGRSALSDYGD